MDDLLAQAQANPPAPPDAMLARIMADAEAQLDRTVPEANPTRRGIGAIWAAIAQIGGLPAVTGMASAAVAGIWIGLASPVAGEGLAQLVWPQSAYALDDLAPSVYAFMLEAQE